MGDYSVLIVSCKLKVKKAEIEKFKEEIYERIGYTDSAYHDTAPFINISDQWSEPKLSMIIQDKYGSRIKDFLDWLEPLSDGGMGGSDVWAMEFDEYSEGPKILRKRYKDQNEKAQS